MFEIVSISQILFRFMSILLLFIAVSSNHRVNGNHINCCRSLQINECTNEDCSDWEPVAICMDGTELYTNPEDSIFCGVGVCDDIGCNCDGGCRKNMLGSLAEAKRFFELRYGRRVLY